MKISKISNLILLLILPLFITSCSLDNSMKPEDFKDKKPRLIIEDYMSGNVKAWGILQNRSGKVIRQFSATSKTIKDAEINAAKKMVDYILKNKLL